MNTDRPAPTVASDADEGVSRLQKARKLRGVYAVRGRLHFGTDGTALYALAEGATFESAMDWLCFNLPGDELPLKFSSSGSIAAADEVGERSIKVISRAQENWIPTQPSNEINEENFGMSIRIKGQQEESLGEPSQADSITQYVKQQEQEKEELDEFMNYL